MMDFSKVLFLSSKTLSIPISSIKFLLLPLMIMGESIVVIVPFFVDRRKETEGEMVSGAEEPAESLHQEKNHRNTNDTFYVLLKWNSMNNFFELLLIG